MRVFDVVNHGFPVGPRLEVLWICQEKMAASVCRAGSALGRTLAKSRSVSVIKSICHHLKYQCSAVVENILYYRLCEHLANRIKWAQLYPVTSWLTLTARIASFLTTSSLHRRCTSAIMLAHRLVMIVMKLPRRSIYEAFQSRMVFNF